MREAGHEINSITSIEALKVSFGYNCADIFNMEVKKLKHEEGSMGAAMLAAYGLGWYASIERVASFIKLKKYLNLIKKSTSNIKIS